MIKDLIRPKKDDAVPENLPVVLVTPKQAKEWLDSRFDNERLIRSNKVKAFARDMREKNWHWTGDTIRFNADGRLMDGQHRLSAIVQSGTSHYFPIVNLPDEARAGIDTGSNRTLGDLLRMGNHIHGRELAAIVRRVLIYRDGLQASSGGRFLPTHSEAMKFTGENSEALLASHRFAVETHKVRFPVSPSALGAAHFVCAKIDRETADATFGRMISGLDIKEGDPVAAFRNRAIRFQTNTGRPMDPDDVFRFGIMTFNFVRKGAHTVRLMTPKGGWNPTNVPVPE